MAQNSAQPVGSVEVPASEHGRGFPPFNTETFVSQLLWLALIFLALYLLMSRIALPRVGSILENLSTVRSALLVDWSANALRRNAQPPSQSSWTSSTRFAVKRAVIEFWSAFF
jgi:F-type H+-transporting ATPase subunit b